MSKYFVGLNIVPDQYCCKPGEFLFITQVLIKLANANKLIALIMPHVDALYYYMFNYTTTNVIFTV